jgi:hypothetical protein
MPFHDDLRSVPEAGWLAEGTGQKAELGLIFFSLCRNNDRLAGTFHRRRTCLL